MKRVLFGFGFAALITGCAETQQAIDDVAQRSAKAAVAETMATRFPAVPSELITPASDCVIESASAGEIARLSRDAVVGVTDQTFALVQEIVLRPQSQTCLTGVLQNSLGSLLEGV